MFEKNGLAGKHQMSRLIFCLCFRMSWAQPLLLISWLQELKTQQKNQRQTIHVSLWFTHLLIFMNFFMKPFFFFVIIHFFLFVLHLHVCNSFQALSSGTSITKKKKQEKKLPESQGICNFIHTVREVYTVKMSHYVLNMFVKLQNRKILFMCLGKVLLRTCDHFFFFFFYMTLTAFFKIYFL